jgi:hypothetical protein
MGHFLVIPAKAGTQNFFSRRDAEAQRGLRCSNASAFSASLREIDSSAFAEWTDEEVAR